MAPFDPQLPPGQTPNWTNVFKPIEQPEADRSKGLALQTTAEGISGVANLAESTAEQYLKEKVQSGVRALQETTTASYENIRNAQITGTKPADQAVQIAGFDGSLLKSNSDIPETLQAGLDRATNLALSKAQGRANDTLFSAQLNSLAKQLRAEYPGHRDFIDQQISQISGRNPANYYMENLLTDINRQSSGSDLFQKQVMTLAERNIGQPDVQKWWLAAQHGVPNAMAGLTQAVFRAEAETAQHKSWQQQHEEFQGTQQDDALIAKGQYETRTNQILSKHIDPILQIPGFTTPATQAKLIQDSLAGKVVLTPEQHNQLLSSFVGQRMQVANAMDDSSNSEGYGRRIRDPSATKAIRDGKLEYYDRMIDAIKNKDYGTLFEMQRELKASQDLTNNQADKSPIGEWARRRSFLTDKLGPNWMNYIDSLGLQRGNLQDVQSFVNGATARAGVADDVRKDGVVKSLYDDLNTVKKAANRGLNVPQKAYDSLVDNVNLITHAHESGKDDVAKEVVNYMFDPAKNGKIMEFFGRDFTDDQGRFHKGKFAVYDILTSPKIADAIWNLHDKDAWQKYKDWQEMSFKTLFGEEVTNLNNIQGDRSMPMDIGWDDKNHKLVPNFGTKPTTTVDQNYQDWAKRSITALNSGLTNLHYMHSKEGTDTNAQVFDMLMQLGYSPNDRLHGDNLPQRVIESIMSTAKPPKPEGTGAAFRAAQ